MEPGTIVLIVFFSFGFLLLLFCLYIGNQEKKRKDDKKQVVGFIRCLVGAFNESGWRLNPAETQAATAKKVTQKIRKHVSTQFLVLMTQITSFPRKCNYSTVEFPTRKLVSDIIPLLSDLHARKKNNPGSVDELQEEFFQKLEEFIFEVVSFDHL